MTKLTTLKGETACIYDWVNSRSKTLSVAIENQKKINLYLLTALEAKNKTMRSMEAEIEKLKVDYFNTNRRLYEHENSGRRVIANELIVC